MKSGACSIEWSLCRPFVLLSLTSTLPNLFPESARGREVLLHLPRTERPRRDRVVGERTSAGSVPSRSALTPALPARAPQARLHPLIQSPSASPTTTLYYSRRAPWMRWRLRPRPMCDWPTPWSTSPRGPRRAQCPGKSCTTGQTFEKSEPRNDFTILPILLHEIWALWVPDLPCERGVVGVMRPG